MKHWTENPCSQTSTAWGGLNFKIKFYLPGIVWNVWICTKQSCFPNPTFTSVQVGKEGVNLQKIAVNWMNIQIYTKITCLPTAFFHGGGAQFTKSCFPKKLNIQFSTDNMFAIQLSLMGWRSQCIKFCKKLSEISRLGKKSYVHPTPTLLGWRGDAG